MIALVSLPAALWLLLAFVLCLAILLAFAAFENKQERKKEELRNLVKLQRLIRETEERKTYFDKEGP